MNQSKSSTKNQTITPDMDDTVTITRTRPRSYTIRNYNGEDFDDFTSGGDTEELSPYQSDDDVELHNEQITALTTLDSSINEFESLLKQNRPCKREYSSLKSSIDNTFPPAAAYICSKLLNNWIKMHQDRDEIIAELEKQREGLISTIEQLKDSACYANTELNKIRTSNKKARHA